MRFNIWKFSNVYITYIVNNNMNKTNFFMGFIFMLVFSVFVVAGTVNNVETSVINSGNGVCEEYNLEMKIGDSDSVTLNGKTFDFKLLSIGIAEQEEHWTSYNIGWEVNGEQGIGLRDYLYNNYGIESGRYLLADGVMGDGVTVEVIFSELDAYKWDCLGYNERRGLYAEVEVNEGWNLVSYDTYFRGCDEVVEGEICRDDVLVEYIYFPNINKYYSMEYLEEYFESLEDKYDSEEEAFANDPFLKSIAGFFMEENEMNIRMSSKWIYVKPGSGSKKMLYHSGSSSSRRDDILNPSEEWDFKGLKLFDGWNFMTVNAFMLYDNSWRFDGLSLEDMKGGCNIERAYWFDSDVQDWAEISPSSKFVDGDIGKGFVVEVSGDCYLGDSRADVVPPTIPGGNNIDRCTDSDGGNSYYEKGLVETSDESVWDYCDGNTLYELNCYEFGGDVSIYACPNGCSDGACVNNNGQVSDYIVESDIGGAVFRSSNEDTQDCILSANTCFRYESSYRYNEKDIGVVVEFDNLDINQFKSNVQIKFPDIGEGNFVGEDYYTGIIGNDVLVIWKSDNKIVALEYDKGSDETADILEDILTVYLPKYPSDLNW